MARIKDLTKLPIADSWREVKDPPTLWGDLTPQAKRTLQQLSENRMSDELASYLPPGPPLRPRPGRKGVRNDV